MLDIRIWIEVDLEVERRRLIRRNFEAGIVDDLVKCAERGGSSLFLVDE